MPTNPQDCSSPFGKQLYEWRCNCGMNQLQLCHAAGIGHGYISSYETGRVHPERHNSDKIADAMGLSRELVWSVVEESRSSWSVSDRRKQFSKTQSVLTTPVNVFVPFEVEEWLRSESQRSGKSKSAIAAQILAAKYYATRNKSKTGAVSSQV